MGVYPGCWKDIKLIIAGYMQVGFVMYSDTAIKYLFSPDTLMHRVCNCCHIDLDDIDWT